MKKLISIILSAIMAFSAFNFVYADEASDYSSIIERVKEIFDIPQYDKFSCEAENENKYLVLNWSNEDNDSFLNIKTDKNMNITYYNKYDENEADTAAVDYAGALSAADEFLKKAAADCYPLYKLDSEKTEKYAKNINFVYSAYINGYLVQGGDANINVSLVDGEVTYYSSKLPVYSRDVSPEKPISVNAAKIGLFSDDNLSLEYKNVWGDKNNISKPLYRFNNIYVNAYTGKLKETEAETDDVAYEAAEDAGYSQASGGSQKNASLTQTELKEIQSLESTVKPEDAARLIGHRFGVNIGADDLKYSYYKNSDDDTYSMYVNYDKDGLYASGEINADNSFSYFACSSETPIVSGYDNIKSYVKAIYPAADVPSDIKTNMLDYYDNNCYEYIFYDKYNGIIDRDSYLELTFDEDYNLVNVYYSYNDAKHTEFSRELTNDEIFNIASEKIGFKPVYCPDKNNGLKLYYTFEKNFSIDAGTREVLSYYGARLSDTFTSYTDVEGKWYEDIANTLINYNYKFNNSKFEGDKAVTGEDVIQFFAGSDADNYRLIASDYSNKFKKYADNPEKEVTKYDIAEIIVDRLNLTELAQKAEFVKPFDDVSQENIPNVAICKAFGIAKGNNGMFEGDKTITRAEMASMVYNYILAAH